MCCALGFLWCVVLSMCSRYVMRLMIKGVCILIYTHLCTITSNCVQCAIDSSSENVNSSNMPILSSQMKMAMVQQLLITETCKSFITDLIPVKHSHASMTVTDLET